MGNGLYSMALNVAIGVASTAVLHKPPPSPPRVWKSEREKTGSNAYIKLCGKIRCNWDEMIKMVGYSSLSAAIPYLVYHTAGWHTLNGFSLHAVHGELRKNIQGEHTLCVVWMCADRDDVTTEQLVVRVLFHFAWLLANAYRHAYRYTSFAPTTDDAVQGLMADPFIHMYMVYCSLACWVFVLSM